MNNLYQQLSQRNLSNNSLQNLISLFKNSKNPQEFLSNYIQNNPQAQDIYNILRNSNRSPKELFYLLAKEKGIDPESILKVLK